MKKLILLIVATALLFSCSGRVSKLPEDIKTWYKLHSILMEAKVPGWIVEGNYSEKKCFLRIPEQAQRLYARLFWEVRREGLADVFYRRVAVARQWYVDETTDMGYAVVLLGLPMDIRYIQNYRYQEKNNTEGYQYQIWYYYHQSLMVSITFEWHLTEWRLALHNIGGMSNYNRLAKKNLKAFEPTEEGWDLIGSWVLSWVKEMNK